MMKNQNKGLGAADFAARLVVGASVIDAFVVWAVV